MVDGAVRVLVMLRWLLSKLAPLPRSDYEHKRAAWSDLVPRYTVTQRAAPRKQWHVVERHTRKAG